MQGFNSYLKVHPHTKNRFLWPKTLMCVVTRPASYQDRSMTVKEEYELIIATE